MVFLTKKRDKVRCMELIIVGRKRKDLIDKSTVLMIRLDNRTIFKLCEIYNIEFDLDCEIISDELKKSIIGEIKNNLENIIK